MGDSEEIQPKDEISQYEHISNNDESINQTESDINNESTSEDTKNDEFTNKPREILIATPFSNHESHFNSSSDEESLVEDDEDSPVDTVNTANSPAFQCINALHKEGHITGAYASALRMKYLKLCSLLDSSRNGENEMLHNSKLFLKTVESQKKELGKSVRYPEGYDSDADRQREQLLKAENTILQIENRMEGLTFQINMLVEEKKMYEREYNRMPKLKDLENRKKQLEKEIDMIAVEFTRKSTESRHLIQSLRELKDVNQVEKHGLDEDKATVEGLKNQLSSIDNVPLQHIKEFDTLSKQKVEAESIFMKACTELDELTSENTILDKHMLALESENGQLMSQISKKQQDIFKWQGQYEGIKRLLEAKKDEATNFVIDKNGVELRIDHVKSELCRENSIVNRRTKERDKKFRGVKRMKQKLDAVHDNLKYNKSNHLTLKNEYNSIIQNKDNYYLLERKKLMKEINQLTKSIAVQSDLTETDHAMLVKLMQDEERLMYVISDLRVELVELNRLATIKADEREHKARDCILAEKRHENIVEEIQNKETIIRDHHKRYSETLIHLSNYSKLYDTIKSDRNKCLNAIQNAHQTKAELDEKLRVHANELDILKSILVQRSESLTKMMKKHVISMATKDKAKNDLSKEVALYNEVKEKNGQLHNQLANFNQMVNRSEESVSQLKKQIEKIVQLRNDRAVQLIERNEEVCIISEKFKLQDKVVTSAEIELQALEEEISILKRQRISLDDRIDILRRQCSSKNELQRTLVTLKVELALECERVLELDQKVENPQLDMKVKDMKSAKKDSKSTPITSRTRHISGHDLKTTELVVKLDKLEMEISKKEKHLVEIDMLLDAINRLNEKLQLNIGDSRKDTLNLSKNMNRYQKDCEKVMKKLRATTAELSMKMSEALKLERECKKKDEELLVCKARIEAGEAPSEEVEAEWYKLVRREKLFKEFAKRDKEEKIKENMMYTAEGVYTTVVPRPNAYLPQELADSSMDNESLTAIAKPYSNFAPFRAAPPGSNMRHIRKPKLKPIEI